MNRLALTVALLCSLILVPTLIISQLPSSPQIVEWTFAVAAVDPVAIGEANLLTGSREHRFEVGTLGSDQADQGTGEACPYCHVQGRIVPIRYGRPSRATLDRWKRGEIELGGCVISSDSPYSHCRACDKDF